MAKSKRDEILGQVGLYSVSTFVTQMITLVAAILTRRFLGPVQMGIWSTLQIIVDYSKYTSLGVMSAVAVEIPYAVGKGDVKSSENIKNAAFTFVITSAVGFSCLVMLFVLLTLGRFSSEVTNGLLLVAAIIFLQRISNLLIALLRCYKRFSIEASQMIWSSVVNAIFIAILSYRFKLYGFIAAMALSYIFNILYVYLKFHFAFHWCFDRTILKKLTVFGLPLMLLGLMTVGLKSIDKIIIAKMLGFKDLGLYSIALMVCSYSSNFYSAAAVVFLPHFQEKFGEKDDPRDLGKYIFKSSLAFVLVMPLFIGLIWACIPYLVSVFLPKFVEGILAMKILSLSIFYVALAHPYQDFLTTVKKHMLLFPVLASSSLLAVILDFCMVKAGYGINGVAAATLLVFIVNFISLYFVSTRHFTDLSVAFKKILLYFGLFLYIVIALVIDTRFVFRSDLSLLQAICRVFFFACAYLPIFYILNKQFAVVSLIKTKLGIFPQKP